ncbi:MAG: S41 family peptidase [Acidobacteriota bacterium]|nr:S41 family peptidase [Acidobacteriota bacterium]
MNNHKSASAIQILLAALAAVGLGLSLIAARQVSAQKISKLEIEQGRNMLSNVKSELKKNYYDPTFHGMEIEERFKLADEKMKNAESNGQLFGIIAQVLLELNDSHTAFVPPMRASRVEYGWQMKAVGADCYVSAVKPGSDAEAKGLKVGDKVLSIDRRPVDRTKLWLANYLYYLLRPQPGMTVAVQKPDGQQQQIVIQAKVREGKKVLEGDFDFRNLMLDAQEEDRLSRHRFYEPSDDVLIWKMPQFDLSEDEVDSKIGKFRNRKALILDLRGNPGGYVTTLERLAGYFFAGDVKLADFKGRKEMKPSIAKGHSDKAFKGQLIVLLDGESSSAAEVFARVMQLEKRGTVIGDRSSGMVMRSRYYPLQTGAVNLILFGMSVTDADLIMADGKSLEHVGVTPDELLLPTPEDMAAGRDPVLAHAASLVGIKLGPDKAGALFPLEWRSR